jgi:hypothetical protein
MHNVTDVRGKNAGWEKELEKKKGENNTAINNTNEKINIQMS